MFKIAVAFHAICGAISLGVLILLWNLGARAGLTDRFSQFLVDIGFAESVKISSGTVLRGAINVVIAVALLNAVLTVLLAVLYNLLSGLLGGLIVSIVEDDNVRVPKSKTERGNPQQKTTAKQPRPAKTAKPPKAANPVRPVSDLPEDDLDDTDWLTDLAMSDESDS